jgi:hypothetical protein
MKRRPENICELGKYFKIGVSDEFILIRRDFPMDKISPGEFSKLIELIFRKNEEVLNGK